MALPAIHFRIGRPDFEIAVAAFRSVRAALPLPLAGPPELHLDAGAIDAIHGSPRAPTARVAPSSTKAPPRMAWPRSRSAGRKSRGWMPKPSGRGPPVSQR